MSTMQLHDLELLKDIPGYKAILKAVLKSQIQMLVQQLSESTGEETVVLSASIMEGTLYHMGSPCGRDFLDGRDEIKSQFLKHCLQKISWKKQDAVSSERSPLSSSHTEAHARTNVINNTSYSHSDDGRVSSRQVASTDMPPSTSGEPLIIQHSQSHSSDLDTSGMREVSSRKRRKRTNKRQVKPRIDADVQESSLAINSEHDYEVIINNESNSETNDEDGTCMEITEGNQMESRDWDPASSGFGDAGNQSGVAGLGTKNTNVDNGGQNSQQETKSR